MILMGQNLEATQFIVDVDADGCFVDMEDDLTCNKDNNQGSDEEPEPEPEDKKAAQDGCLRTVQVACFLFCHWPCLDQTLSHFQARIPTGRWHDGGHDTYQINSNIDEIRPERCPRFAH